MLPKGPRKFRPRRPTRSKTVVQRFRVTVRRGVKEVVSYVPMYEYRRALDKVLRGIEPSAPEETRVTLAGRVIKPKEIPPPTDREFQQMVLQSLFQPQAKMGKVVDWEVVDWFSPSTKEMQDAVEHPPESLRDYSTTDPANPDNWTKK